MSQIRRSTRLQSKRGDAPVTHADLDEVKTSAQEQVKHLQQKIKEYDEKLEDVKRKLLECILYVRQYALITTNGFHKLSKAADASKVPAVAASAAAAGVAADPLFFAAATPSSTVGTVPH